MMRGHHSGFLPWALVIMLGLEKAWGSTDLVRLSGFGRRDQHSIVPFPHGRPVEPGGR